MMRTITALLLLAMTLSLHASPDSDFWDWFTVNRAKLEAVKDSDSPTLEDLSKQLKAVHEDLVYEMSLHNGDVREIIISGDGLKAMIPVVQRLTSAAPKIEGWKVIAFRPRMKDYSGFHLEYSGEEFQPKKVWFHPITKEGHFDVILYHPDYTEEDRNKFVGGTYIMLDMALGEFDVMTKVRYIDHQKLPADPEKEGLLPFTELREVFDAFQKTKTEQEGADRPPTGAELKTEGKPDSLP